MTKTAPDYFPWVWAYRKFDRPLDIFIVFWFFTKRNWLFEKGVLV